MKFVSLIFVAVLTLTVFAVYQFVGFGPGREGAWLRPYDGAIPKSYFKTPQTATETTGALVAAQNWERLAQFYDIPNTSAEAAGLKSGDYFRTRSPGERQARPFDAGYVFREILGTEYEDVFEIVVVRRGTENALDQMQFFYLKRYPEGYRILPGRPQDEAVDAFQ